VHHFGCGTDAAGFGQSQKKAQLSEADVHRFLSIVNGVRIDFTRGLHLFMIGARNPACKI
jgi:hypothetical protein